MNSISANELKTRGVTALEAALQADNEAVITVRGESKYVVVDFETYNKFREYELDIALQEARLDVKQGAVSRESIDEHIARVVK